MPMVALNSDRTKVVPTGSLEARWMVDEEEAATYIEEAKEHPKMQEVMRAAEARRLEDEAETVLRLEAEAAYKAGVSR